MPELTMNFNSRQFDRPAMTGKSAGSGMRPFIWHG